MGRILYRLGYKKTKTKLDDNQRERIEELIWQGVSPAAQGALFNIANNQANGRQHYYR